MRSEKISIACAVKHFTLLGIVLIPILSLPRRHLSESAFSSRLCRDFFVQLGGAEGLLLVQCDNGEANFNLIACCRYLVEDIRRRTIEDIIQTSVKPIHIIFIIQLPKIAGGCQHFVGFQGGKWQSAHIDELLESNEQLPQIEQLINRSVSDLFEPEKPARNDDIEDMEIEQRPNDSQDVDVDLDVRSEPQAELAEVKQLRNNITSVIQIFRMISA